MTPAKGFWSHLSVRSVLLLCRDVHRTSAPIWKPGYFFRDTLKSCSGVTKKMRAGKINLLARITVNKICCKFVQIELIITYYAIISHRERICLTARYGNETRGWRLAASRERFPSQAVSVHADRRSGRRLSATQTQMCRQDYIAEPRIVFSQGFVPLRA